MKTIFKRGLVLVLCLSFLGYAGAQKKKTTTKKTTTTKRTTPKKKVTKQTAPVTSTIPTVTSTPIVKKDTVPTVDSLPVPVVKKSLRNDNGIERNLIKEKTPLPYEDLREDDAMWSQKVWREIDTREKINLPFRYAADEDNGNQRFISILFNAIQKGDVTAFSAIDDRFTTPLTLSQVAKVVAGEPVVVPQFDSLGNSLPPIIKPAEINLDSIYRFRIKEQVIFDKESSRLFWRILGIAPVTSVISSEGVNLGDKELFWVYYPDMRPTFAKYEVYNGKNYGARMSWEELFESRMFYGRIIKSTMDNPYDQFIKDQQGFKNNKLFQLYEGENIKEKIFNFEQGLWSY
ncbi:MAG: gliding motility protein GldN [Ginsengibacter sp.]|jgi:gliding motility associated protien GldN